MYVLSHVAVESVNYLVGKFKLPMAGIHIRAIMRLVMRVEMAEHRAYFSDDWNVSQCFLPTMRMTYFFLN